MNDEKLDELLELKKNIRGDFSKTPEVFANEFFERVRQTSVRKFSVWPWRVAAGFLIVVALVAVFALPLLQKPCATADSYRKLAETVRLFGSDAAVLFFGNELVTGERESKKAPANFVDVTLWAGTKKIDLMLACSDSDSIYIDTTGVFGNVVISRCDALTLVLDVELTVNGHQVRTIIPVMRRSGNYYEADVLS